MKLITISIIIAMSLINVVKAGVFMIPSSSVKTWQHTTVKNPTNDQLIDMSILYDESGKAAFTIVKAPEQEFILFSATDKTCGKKHTLRDVTITLDGIENTITPFNDGKSKTDHSVQFKNGWLNENLTAAKAIKVVVYCFDGAMQYNFNVE